MATPDGTVQSATKGRMIKTNDVRFETIYVLNLFKIQLYQGDSGCSETGEFRFATDTGKSWPKPSPVLILVDAAICNFI